MTGSGLSPEARAFLDDYVVDRTPTDFSDIERVRAETRAGFSGAAERAIVRHDLRRREDVIGGVPCERITAGDGTPTAVLLYVFGGAFIVGDPYSDLPIIGALAAGCGVEVVAPLYRLAPEAPAPAAADDCLSVYRALVASGEPPALLAGESAGGNLALVVAQRARAEGLPSARAMALLSPAADLRSDPALFEPVIDRDPTLDYGRVLEVERVYIAGGAATDPAVSPVFGELDRLPPTIITTGTRDLLMPTCLRLARAMWRAGAEVDLRVWDGLWHVFEFYDEYPESAESLIEIAAFLRRRLG